MNAENDRAPVDILDRATTALRDATPVDPPPPALVASTIAAMKSLDSNPKVVLRDTRKWLVPRS